MSRSLLVVLGLALVLTGCTKEEPAITANDQVPAAFRTEEAPEGATDGNIEEEGGGTWVAVDIDFEAAPNDLSSGSEITLVNNGQAEHNVTIDGEVILEASGGDTDTATLDLAPGTYEYVCSVPGHADLMNGTLTVTE